MLGRHHFRFFGRQVPSGFTLTANGSLASYKLGSTCEEVLYQALACDCYVASLSALKYHGSLSDDEFTATVKVQYIRTRNLVATLLETKETVY